MKKQVININEQTLSILIDEENKMVKINNILFEKLEDFVLTVNKLTDIAEELLEDNYEGSNEI